MTAAAPRWMSGWLKAAGVYNVLWGGLTVLYPAWLFDLTGMDPPLYPFIWQCVGMIVGVYGLGYWIAASDPLRHWPIVLVGMLGKIFGPLGYLGGQVTGEVPIEFGVTLITNDLIWWIPFALILAEAFRSESEGDIAEGTDPRTAMAEASASDGRTLLEISNASPALVVFLRHTGCTFCKEALADLSVQRDRLGSLVLVSMSSHEAFAQHAARYGLADVPHISDPSRRLYRSFELGRGSLGQLFGLRVWLRGAGALFRGHGVGRLAGDGFQMPGAFLVESGRIVRALRHRTAADRPDYCELAGAAPRSAEATPA